MEPIALLTQILTELKTLNARNAERDKIDTERLAERDAKIDGFLKHLKNFLPPMEN